MVKFMVPVLNVRASESIAETLSEYEPLTQIDVSKETEPTEVLVEELRWLVPCEHGALLRLKHHELIESAPGW